MPSFARLVAADLNPTQRSRQAYGLNTTMEYLQEKRAANLQQIERLTKPNYYPKVVYVVFNSEHDQRKCIRDCATGLLEELFNMQCFSMNDNSTMNGQVLKVEEPVEPSEVIYEVRCCE